MEGMSATAGDTWVCVCVQAIRLSSQACLGPEHASAQVCTRAHTAYLAPLLEGLSCQMNYCPSMNVRKHTVHAPVHTRMHPRVCT